MDQILHIFRKDIRRHMYEIFVSLALLGAIVWSEPSQWVPQRFSGDFARYALAQFLPNLLVIAWLLLVVRVVQGEALVGDRQFWVTRPYEWKKLLIAKALFFVAFVNIPLLFAQIALLREAGSAPTSYVRGLFWMQLLWVLYFILPTMTLAAITPSLGQGVLVLLGILLALIGLVALSSVALFQSQAPPVESNWTSLVLVVLIGACAAAVVWQYMRRKAWQSRLMLIGAAITGLLLMGFAPQQILTEREYPQPSAGQQPPVQLAFDPGRQTTEEFTSSEKNKVWVSIPLLASGIAPGAAVAIDAITVKIEAPGGLSWNSHWVGSNPFLIPGQPQTNVDFFMRKDFFDRVKWSTARVHISFAVTAFKATAVDRTVATDDEFNAPGGTSCWIGSRSESTMQCRSPLRSPFLLATIIPEETTCRLDDTDKAALRGTVVSGTNLDRSTAPAEFAVSPVTLTFVFLSRTSTWDSSKNEVLCPGTPLTFSTLEEGQRTRTELTIDALRLADYQLHDSRQTGQ
jgi:hypothetical protein